MLKKIRIDIKPKVFIFCDYYWPAYKAGGPIRTLKNIVDIYSRDLDFYIVTRASDLHDKHKLFDIKVNTFYKRENYHVIYLNKNFFQHIVFLLTLVVAKSDIIFLNSFFSLRFSIIPLLIIKLRGLKNRIILAVRGEHSYAALGLKSFKKRIFIAVTNPIHLHKDILFIASSKFELEDIKRTLHYSSEVMVIPNLIVRKAHNYSNKVKNIPLKLVFLSRISPIKNLEFVLKILEVIKFPYILNIFGPIEDKKYFDACISTVPKEHIPNIHYCGVVPEDEVSNIFREHDLLFFPTKSENFGHVIFEALDAGCPVLISDQTPWKNLEEKEIGWDIPLADKEKFIEVLNKIANMNPSEYEKLTSNAVRFTKEYSENQNKIAIAAYKELFELKTC